MWKKKRRLREALRATRPSRQRGINPPRRIPPATRLWLRLRRAPWRMWTRQLL
uniref:Uncharacterized protein n=1 Tax=Arundo donax TaxID=35708 RepID=A0A0A9GWT7_ARUDO